MTHAAFAFLAYFLGSIPSGLLLARLKGIDIRRSGSGNIGFSNVMRVAGTDRKGRLLGFLTLAGDMGKGFLAVRLAVRYGTPTDTILAALLVFIGHLYPVWLRGKGGKGVATGLGVAFGFNPLLGLGACLPWAILFIVTRTPSIASIGSFLVLPFLSLPLVPWPWMKPGLLPPDTPVLFGVISALVIIRHRENIKRLFSGEENLL